MESKFTEEQINNTMTNAIKGWSPIQDLIILNHGNTVGILIAKLHSMHTGLPIYYEKQGQTFDGWFFLRRDYIENRLGICKRAQCEAFKIIKNLGIINTKIKKYSENKNHCDNRIWYKFNEFTYKLYISKLETEYQIKEDLSKKSTHTLGAKNAPTLGAKNAPTLGAKNAPTILDIDNRLEVNKKSISKEILVSSGELTINPLNNSNTFLEQDNSNTQTSSNKKFIRKDTLKNLSDKAPAPVDTIPEKKEFPKSIFIETWNGFDHCAHSKRTSQVYKTTSDYFKQLMNGTFFKDKKWEDDFINKPEVQSIFDKKWTVDDIMEGLFHTHNLCLEGYYPLNIETKIKHRKRLLKDFLYSPYSGFSFFINAFIKKSRPIADYAPKDDNPVLTKFLADKMKIDMAKLNKSGVIKLIDARVNITKFHQWLILTKAKPDKLGRIDEFFKTPEKLIQVYAKWCRDENFNGHPIEPHMIGPTVTHWKRFLEWIYDTYYGEYYFPWDSPPISELPYEKYKIAQ